MIIIVNYHTRWSFWIYDLKYVMTSMMNRSILGATVACRQFLCVRPDAFLFYYCHHYYFYKYKLFNLQVPSIFLTVCCLLTFNSLLWQVNLSYYSHGLTPVHPTIHPFMLRHSPHKIIFTTPLVLLLYYYIRTWLPGTCSPTP